MLLPLRSNRVLRKFLQLIHAAHFSLVAFFWRSQSVGRKEMGMFWCRMWLWKAKIFLWRGLLVWIKKKKCIHTSFLIISLGESASYCWFLGELSLTWDVRVSYHFVWIWAFWNVGCGFYIWKWEVVSVFPVLLILKNALIMAK